MGRYSRKDGKPSVYEFLCGAVYRRTLNDHNSVAIDMEYRCYHIKGFVNGNHFWESTNSNKEAWKIFHNKWREIRGTHATR